MDCLEFDGIITNYSIGDQLPNYFSDRKGLKYLSGCPCIVDINYCSTPVINRTYIITKNFYPSEHEI